MKMKLFWKNKSNTQTIPREVTKEDVAYAYKSSKKEIESLKKYDRGEKVITPSKLRDLVRNI